MLPGQLASDPRISPILAPTESFPKYVYLACGNADTLYEPSRRFVERLRDAGHHDAEFVGVEREAHSFDKLTKEGSQTAGKKDMVYDGAVDMINKALHLVA
jgi:acetyl esterase/lipase